jgi:RNase P/RNase MRP subunit POP5
MCLSTTARRESALLKIKELIDKSGAVALLQQRCEVLFGESESAITSDVFTTEESTALRGVLATVRQQVRQVA